MALLATVGINSIKHQQLAPVININRADPTRTISLRRQFSAQMTNRFRALKGAINRKLIEEDFLGAHEGIQVLAFEYRWGDRKAKAFMGWLRAQQDAGILEIIQRQGLAGMSGSVPWTDTYIQSAYQKGIAQGRFNLRSEGAEIPSFATLPGVSEASIAFNQPFHAERVALIYTRVFEELKGVTATMDQQISRALARGMAEGRSPNDIAISINDRVDKIGLTRARLIARTEIVHTHNIAALNEYERTQGFIGEKIKVQWFTARDSRVRPTHISRHEKVYEQDFARTLIGEPNCRCALLPYVEEWHKEDEPEPTPPPAPEDKGMFSKPEYKRKFDQYSKQYRGLTEKQYRDAVRNDCPDLYDTLDSWQGSTQRPQTIALKFLAQEIEGKQLQTFYRRKFSDANLNKIFEWSKDEVLQDQYLRVRAMTAEYYKKKNRKFITLYRGTDGENSGPKFKDQCVAATENAKKRGWNPDNVHVRLKENSLVGYTSDQNVAHDFGKSSVYQGVTVKYRIPVDDIVLPHEIWPKNGFMDEKEFIVLGDLERKIILKNCYWRGK